jgi:hypothetical protein
MLENLNIFKTIKTLNENPIFIKEILQKQRGKSKDFKRTPGWAWYCLLLFISLTAILPTLGMPDKYTRSLDFAWVIILQVCLYGFRAGLKSSGLIVKEKENRTLDLLASTLITPEQIITGKFWFVFKSLALELTYIAPLYVMVGLLAKCPPISIFAGYVITLVNIAVCAINGLKHSAGSGSIREAKGITGNTIPCLFLWQFHTIIDLVIRQLFLSFFLPYGHKTYVIIVNNTLNFYLDNPFLLIIDPFSPFISYMFYAIQPDAVSVNPHPAMILLIPYIFLLYYALFRLDYKRTVIRLSTLMTGDKPKQEKKK